MKILFSGILDFLLEVNISLDFTEVLPVKLKYFFIFSVIYQTMLTH